MGRSVLFLTNAYPDSPSSNRVIFIKKLAGLLQKDGNVISVVTPRIYNNTRYFEDQDGIKIYRFPFLSGNKLLIEYKTIPFLRMLLYYVSGVACTIYALLRNRCSLIHVHWAIPTGLIAVVAGLILKRPYVVSVHGSDFRIAVNSAGFLRRIFLLVCHRAIHINCVSEVMRREIEGMGIQEDKISTFPMGVEIGFLEVGKNRDKELSTKHPTVISNRNLYRNYNVGLLVRSIPEVLKEEPHTKFLIAGDGPERPDLEAQVEMLRLTSHVQFLGRVPHESMPGLLAQSDVYVSTSLSDGASVSLLEAMGSGAFPIVTDIPANREWISDGMNGFLVPGDDESVLAARIIEVIRNQRWIERGRAKNIHIVEDRASWQVNAAKLRALYTGIQTI
jgi:L-malate glycosyltransferase